MHTNSSASPVPVAAADGDTVVHQWAQTTASVPRARQALRGILREWQLGDLADDCALVLCELLANAVEHARCPGPDRTVQTRLSRLSGGGGVRIEVHDGDAGRLPRVRAAGSGEDGRGLRIVEACTRRRWGVEVGAGGKAVWGEVAR